MKEFGNINTELPYKESKSYVNALVENSMETSRLHGRVERKMNRNLVYILAGVATAAAIVLAVVIPSGRKTLQPEISPIEMFLASISDFEAAMIVDWPIEDIPEYY